ncbi:hypothetical protein M5G07_13240 [Serratia symbiotica]|nr:hypothetical protein [Serratia symbiotica]
MTAPGKWKYHASLHDGDIARSLLIVKIKMGMLILVGHHACTVKTGQYPIKLTLHQCQLVFLRGLTMQSAGQQQ